jgi:topoisomerase IA-like protein
MATIADLRTSITSMDDQEAFALIKEIRFLRRQPPPKTSRKTTTTKPATAKSLVRTMTAEQKKKLLEDLGGL